jgi:hypothetical protein
MGLLYEGEAMIDYATCELPRLVTGMSMYEYLNIPLPSRSYLTAVKMGGGEVQRWLDAGKRLRADTKSTSIGTAFDDIVMNILSGKSFDDSVVVPPVDVLAKNGARSGNAYKEWAAEQKGIIVSESEKEVFETMLDHMYENPAARYLLDNTVSTQDVGLYELGGLRMKYRPDGVTRELVWDLKTTSKSFSDLARSVLSYGYAEQDFIYQHAAAAVQGLVDFAMPFVFVQTMPPYACRVHTLPQDFVQGVGAQLMSVIEDVVLRQQTGEYLPPASETITELALPQWALNLEGVVDLEGDE